MQNRSRTEAPATAPAPKSSSRLNLRSLRPLTLCVVALTAMNAGCSCGKKKPAEPPKPVAAAAAPAPMMLPPGTPEEQRLAAAKAVTDAELSRLAKLEAQSIPLMQRRAQIEAAPPSDEAARTGLARELDANRDQIARGLGYDPLVARVLTELVTPWYFNELKADQVRRALDRVHNGEPPPAPVAQPAAAKGKQPQPPPAPADPQARERELSAKLERLVGEQQQFQARYGKEFVALLKAHQMEFSKIYMNAFEEYRPK